MFCPKCGIENDDDCGFCKSCGEKLTDDSLETAAENITAPANVTDAETVAAATPEAEETILAGETAGAEEETSEISPETAGPATAKKPFKYTGRIVASVVIILFFILYIILIAALVKADLYKADSMLAYIKDGEVYISTDYGEGVQLTENAFNGMYSATSARNIMDSILFSKDGKHVFYFDNYSYFGFDLYKCDINGSSLTKTKLDSMVFDFKIASDGSSATYIRYSGGTISDEICIELCHTDFKETTVIAKNVSEYYVSEDGKFFYYMVGEVLYSNNGKKETIIENNVAGCYGSSDLSEFVFERDNELYSVNKKGGITPISSNSSVVANDGSNVYYVEETEEGKYILYFRKDRKTTQVADDFYALLYSEESALIYLTNDEELVAVVDGKTTKIPDQNIINIAFTSDYDKLYYLKSTDNEDYGDFCYISLTGEDPKVTVIASRSFTSDDVILFEDNILLGVDDSGVTSATLHYLKNNGYAREIYSDVYEVDISDDGKVVYLRDYGNDAGDLYLWNGKKSVKIDTGVELFHCVNFD